jgi:carboxypeptidase Taq
MRDYATQFTELRARLQELDDLVKAGDVLNWDQHTNMPTGGRAARGRQMATLQRLAHEKFIDPSVGRLLDDLEPQVEGLPYESDDRALVRLTRRRYEQASRVPPSFSAEMAEHSTAAFAVWAQARPANDFARVAPYLQKTLDLSRRFADFFPGYGHIADPLINNGDYGLTVAAIRPLFAELRQQLAPLVQQMSDQPPIDDHILHRHYSTQKQLAFGEQVIRAVGYDFSRGRQDLSLHPFSTKFSIGDVRITTRVNKYDLSEALFGSLHEAGHAMYEQGINPQFEGTPLAEGASMGLHESQSRLWENLVGRNLPFWQHFYPHLQATFSTQLGKVSLEEFYRAINKVQRSLIRTDADEVTYNLHIIIRFELELALLEGSLSLAELPSAWHAAYDANLGIHAPDDRDGVLQDVHWYGGTIGGMFQGYALGNILAAQFYGAAVQAHPEIPSQIAAGYFATLHTWLREQIYQQGSKFTASELVQRVTGGGLSLQPYLDYLHGKFGALYGVGG